MKSKMNDLKKHLFQSLVMGGFRVMQLRADVRFEDDSAICFVRRSAEHLLHGQEFLTPKLTALSDLVVRVAGDSSAISKNRFTGSMIPIQVPGHDS